jgi:hypothetical protein
MLSFRVFAGYHFDSSGRLPRPRPALTPLFATLTDSTSCKSFTCHSYENTGGVYELFPFRNPCLTIRTHHTFRINTCKSVSKQTTLTFFRMNTYEKHRGRGDTDRPFSRCKPSLGVLGLHSYGIRNILCSFSVLLPQSFCSVFRPPVPHRARNGSKHSSRDCSALWGYKSDSRNSL